MSDYSIAGSSRNGGRYYVVNETSHKAVGPYFASKDDARAWLMQKKATNKRANRKRRSSNSYGNIFGGRSRGGLFY